MATPDIEATFEDDYIPPYMRWNCNEIPGKQRWDKAQMRVKAYKPRRRRWGKIWSAELGCYVLEDCSLAYRGTGRPMTPRYEVPEVKKSRW